METQSTQHGLMQMFSALGVAADTKLSVTNELAEQDFSSLLSGLLPSNTGQERPLEDESLPHLGQALPLELLVSDSLAINADALDSDALGLDASLVLDPATKREKTSEVAVEDETSGNLLEQQGFYAQSLVSSLIDQKAISSYSNGMNASSIAVESSTAAPLMPAYLNQGSPTTTLTASELERDADINDRFLGSETTSALVSPKKTVLELMVAPQAPAVLSPSSPSEANLNLALALNEDPTSQTLDELIDGEVLEKGELEVKSNALERKQDDQTLKLTKGQQAWGDALTERITMNAAKDIKQVTIHLDPPELGSLELKLHIKDDQQTQVHVQVQNQQVKEALESSAHRLRDMLAGQGLDLSEFDVQADTGRGEQSLSDSRQQQGEEQSQDSDASQDAGEEISVEIAKSKNNNILDTFV